MKFVLTGAQPLPVWLAGAAANPPDDPEAGLGQSQVAADHLKVLIVEDEFFIALDVQAHVEALGHTVVGMAVSADEAVTMVDREKPDVVLMDIRLVGPRDGIDAAVEIRDRFGVQSIFVTANTDPATLQRAQAIEPLGVLNKPVTQTGLRQQFSRVQLS
jgi:CheY-like chemotaxis protein